MGAQEAYACKDAVPTGLGLGWAIRRRPSTDIIDS